MHGSKGRGWKRALATARGSEHRRETGGISATAYGSYRASPLPDRDPNLRALYLSRNQFSGCIPKELSQRRFDDIKEFGLPFCE